MSKTRSCLTQSFTLGLLDLDELTNCTIQDILDHFKPHHANTAFSVPKALVTESSIFLLYASAPSSSSFRFTLPETRCDQSSEKEKTQQTPSSKKNACFNLFQLQPLITSTDMNFFRRKLHVVPGSAKYQGVANAMIVQA